MKIKEIMDNPGAACRPDSNLAAVAGLMWDKDCGVAPVVDEAGKVVGMITDRDICIAVATKGRLASDIPVSEVMSTDISSCRLDDQIEIALKLMQERNVFRLPVIDDEGTLQGVLSIYGVVLHAGNGKAKKNPPLSAPRVVSVLKSIAAHRTSNPSDKREKSRGARV